MYYSIFGIPFMYKKKKGLTLKQLQEWEAMDRIDPVGSWRDDFRMAVLASTVENLAIAIYGKKGTKLSVPMDFMPDWSGEIKEVEKQTPQQMREILLAMARSQNKKVGIQTKEIKKLPKKDG